MTRMLGNFYTIILESAKCCIPPNINKIFCFYFFGFVIDSFAQNTGVIKI